MRRRGLVVAACTAAGLVLALWVTNVGRVDLAGPPHDPFTLPTLKPHPPTARPSPAGGATPKPTPTAAPDSAAATAWIAGVLRVLVLLALAGLLVLAAIRLRRWLRRWLAERKHRVAPQDFEPLLPPEDAVADAVGAGADEQFAALARGTPRNAVVACWLALEDAVERAGLPHHPAETSQEFTERVLATYAVDPDAINRLARLYREARFSEHELGEDARTQASTALRDLHGALEVARRAAEAEAARRAAEADRDVGQRA